MNSKDSEYFKKMLLEKRGEILQSKGLELSATEQEANSGDLQYTTHMADLGSDSMGKELSSYFKARTGKYLKHLEDALKRIKRGSYGLCLSCGADIQRERLEAVPHTRYCVGCKDKNN